MKKSLIFLFSVSYFITNAQSQFSVFFDSNKYELSKKELANLQQFTINNSTIKIIGANGFCDEDGSTVANDTLAKRRINTVFNIIKSKLKFREDFKTRSFGELHNLSKIKSENRKVILYYIDPKDFAREDEILGIKKPDIKPIIKSEIKFPEKITLQNMDGTAVDIPLDQQFMKEINEAKTGQILNIQNLNFIINTFIVIEQSRARMYELLTVLQLNPTLKIQIQGHLCCNVVDKKDLSGQRAKAIYNFLVANEVSKSRLSHIGFGGTKALFPIPEKSESERAANRRVEILIIQN